MKKTITVEKQIATILLTLLLGFMSGLYIMGTRQSQAPEQEKKGITLPQQSTSLGTYRVTAYCPCEKCCGAWADGETACGHVIQPGDRFVAADRSIDIGTMLEIPGYGTVPVLDRGGAIKGKRLDVFFSTHQEALNWGVKHLVINLSKDNLL